MAKAVYGGLIKTILEVVGPRNPELVGAVSLWRTRWKAMPGVLLFTGIRSWCTQMGAPTTSEGSSCYLKRTNGRGRAATTRVTSNENIPSRREQASQCRRAPQR